MNSDWKECRLGEVAEFKNGKSRPSEIESGTIPIYGGNGILGYTDTFNYQGETVIVGRVGAYCGSVFYENKPIWVSDNALYTIPKNKTDAKFLYYLLNNMSLNSQAEGSSHPLLTQTLLNSLDVFITDSLPEQRTIAGVLSSLDDKIDLLHRQNKTLEGMAEALWRKMFVEEADPRWQRGKLGDVCEKITKGTTPTTLKKNFVDEGINFVKVESIDENGQFIAEKFAHIDEETNTLLQRSILQENDILYSIAGTIGRIAVVTSEILPANTNQALAIIRLKNIELYLPFVRLLLKTSGMTNDLGSKIVHAVQPNLSLGEIAETELIMPDDRSLAAFNLKVNGLYSKINLNTQQIRNLSRMRDTLLPKLMNGEVKVRL